MKYPDRTPVVITYGTPDPRFANVKTKFLTHNTMSLSEFMFVLRKHLPALRPEEALFLTTTHTREIPRASSLISELYQAHSVDSTLHLTVSLENTFGFHPRAPRRLFNLKIKNLGLNK